MKFKLYYPARKGINENTGKPKLYYDKESSGIFLYHHEKNLRHKYGLNINVRVKNWSDKSQEATEADNYWMEADSINAKLRNVKLAFSQYVKDCNHDGNLITRDGIVYAVDIALDSSKSEEAIKIKEQLSLVELWQKFINKPTYDIKEQTLRQKRVALNAIINYNENFKKNPINFNSIDLAQRTHFLNFYRKEQPWKNKTNGKIKIKPPKKKNTLWSYMKELKWFLKYAEDEKKYKVNQSYKSKKFGYKAVKVKNAYLTLDEIEQVSNIDKGLLTTIQAHALDMFIVSCSTGLRLSDIKRLTHQHIKNKDGRLFIHIKPLKTEADDINVIIPVKARIVPIINSLPFPSIETTTVNRAIKKIMKIAKIDKGLPISSHSGRRSFCTNAYQSGMRVYNIMKISGHTTEVQFFEYLKDTEQEIADEIANHPFMQ